MVKTFRFFLTVALLLYVNSVSAEFEPEPGTQGDDIPLVKDEHEKTIDDMYQATSEMLFSAADWIDSFFNDQRYGQEDNKTRSKVWLSFG